MATYTEINSRALDSLSDFLTSWLPNGKRQGREYVATNPTRADTRPGSFKINLDTAVWSDFAADDRGKGAISIYQYLNGGDTKTAAKAVANMVGLEIKGDKKVTYYQRPPQTHPTLGKPSDIYTYSDFFKVYRWNLQGGKKEVRPLSKSDQGWRWADPPKPLPLYNSGILEKSPAATVVFCEGEKTANAVSKLFPECVGVTTAHGAKSPQNSNFSPLKGRSLIIYPDNDIPGEKYAQKIAQLARQAGASDVQIAALPGQARPAGWDLADALVEGLTREQVEKLMPILPMATVLPTVTMDFPLTDMGNGERFAYQQTKTAKFCFQWDNWLIWNDKYWELDDGGKSFALAKEVVRSIYQSAANATSNDEKRKEIAKHAINSESRKAISNMLWCGSREQNMSVKPEKLDQNKWLLNVSNGTINLVTGQFQKHNSEDYITKLVNIHYHPQATCPTWLRFLDSVTGGDKELIHYLHKAIGYSLTGDTREQCFFFLYGFGSNGKSTFIKILEELMGSRQYALRTPAETLMKKKSDSGVPNDKAMLAGVRVAIAAEISEGSTLNESFIKDVTGQDTITARFLHKEFFDFTPQFKLWMYGNHKPLINGTDHGIRRRPRLIPFTQTFSGNQKDPKLADKLIAELPGILAWAIQGCLLWQTEGLDSPTCVTQATEEYFDEMDIVGIFIKDCCETGEAVQATSKALYEKYVRWSLENGERAMNQRRFGQKLTEKGFKRYKANSINWWIGIECALDPISPLEYPSEYPSENQRYLEKAELIQPDSGVCSPLSTLSTLKTEFSSRGTENFEKLRIQGTKGTECEINLMVPCFHDTDARVLNGYFEGTKGTNSNDVPKYNSPLEEAVAEEHEAMRETKFSGRFAAELNYIHGKLPTGLLKEDTKWLAGQFAKVRSEYLPSVINGYVSVYLQEFEKESQERLKEGQGRREANGWLLDTVSRGE